MNLQELTGYESGIVVFKQSGEVIITNWSSIEGIPRVFAGSIIGLNDGDDLIKIENDDNVNEDLIDFAIRIAKEEGKDENPTIDEIWENDECCIITLKGWN